MISEVQVVFGSHKCSTLSEIESAIATVRVVVMEEGVKVEVIQHVASCKGALAVYC